MFYTALLYQKVWDARKNVIIGSNITQRQRGSDIARVPKMGTLVTKGCKNTTFVTYLYVYQIRLKNRPNKFT